MYRQGWNRHEAIQADFPGLHAEQVDTFSDPSLPFDIGYHPDLHDPVKHVVYEIKPLKWYEKNIELCVAQLSGYCHFKEATGIFLLYTNDGYTGANMPYVILWEQLREIALKSWAMRPKIENTSSPAI